MPHKLTDDDLMKLSHLLIQDADEYLSEEISHARAKAMRYYLGDNPDNMPTPEGRSKMVDTQVRDTIEWIMPDLVRTFAGDDEVVAIEPHGQEDSFDANLAEEWVNYVIMRQNKGFLTTHHWIKDALMSKMGFIKQYWKTEQNRKRDDYEGLTDDEKEFLDRAEDYEVVDTASTVKTAVTLPDGTQAMVLDAELVPGMEPIVDEEGDPVMERSWDVAGYQISEEYRIVEDPIPPEEILFRQNAKEIPWKCDFIAHKRQTTLGELREMFPEADLPDDLAGWNITESGLYDEESIERFYDSSQTIGLEDDDGQKLFIDPSLRTVWHYEVYMKADRDGDGVPEWLQIHRVGDVLLEVDEVTYPKIFAITPVLFPHRAVGLSMADLVMDLQELQTALNRQILDNIYLTNNPRHEISMQGATEDTIDDYLDDRIGGYVRVETPGTITPLQNPQMQPWTFNLLEHWEQKRESRTGVSRLNGGMDPDSLNKTATGVVQILNQAARRIEMIARIFAETGFRDRVQGILDLSMEYPDYVKGQILRLTGENIEMDPEKITGRFDLIVNAGIGSGNRDQHAAHMMQLMQVHQQLVMAGMGPGAEMQMVTTKNIYNTVRDLITNWGHRNTVDYITDPNDESADKDPVQEKGPSPDELKMQLEQQKMEAQKQKDQGELKLKQQELQSDTQIEMEKLKLERAKLALEERKLKLEEWKTGRDAAERERPEVVDELEERRLALEEEKARNEMLMKEREVRAAEREAEGQEELEAATKELAEKIEAFVAAAKKPQKVKRNDEGLIEEIS